MAQIAAPHALIVGSSSDVHVQSVCEQLPAHCRPLIVDYARFPTRFAGSLAMGEGVRATLSEASGEEIVLDEVRSIWWRRPRPFDVLAFGSASEQHHVRVQCEFFWTSLLSTIPGARWYNDWRADSAIDRNAVQLRMARALGLRTPDTLITSSPAAAKVFADRHAAVVYKAFGGSAEHWKPTQLLTGDAWESLWGQPPYPVILQEYIDGAFDYRVTLIDDFCEAVEFDTGGSSYPYDVRVDAAVACRRCMMDEQDIARLQRLLRDAGLRFGAFDLRRNKRGELVFLEVNPSGQFVYLDRRAGTRIAKAMADRLAC